MTHVTFMTFLLFSPRHCFDEQRSPSRVFVEINVLVKTIETPQVMV